MIDENDEPLSQEQAKLYGEALRAIESRLDGLADSSDQHMDEIRGGFRRLERNSTTQSRWCLLYSTFGFLMGAALTLSLAPEEARELLEVAGQAMVVVFQAGMSVIP